MVAALALLAAMLACSLPGTVGYTPAPIAERPARSTAAPVTPSVTVETALVTRVPSATPGSGVTRGPEIDFEALKQQMLALINDDRAAAGLSPVATDAVAAQAAQTHAGEMARYGYMSHWDLSGNGPPYRYSQAGGLDASQENVYMYWQRYDNGQPAPIDSWPDVIRQAEASLMDSPGHRANILAPEHTGVGLGLAYNAETGDVRVDQLFTNHYVELAPIPRQVALGELVTLAGQLGPGVGQPLLNLAYEPFPQPLTVAELNQTGVYSSPAAIYDALDVGADANGHLTKQIKLDNQGRPGLYYIRLWVQTRYGEILACEIAVTVR